jgi:hypothetical protein
MRLLQIIIAIACLAFVPHQQGWQKLFDGKSLSGWHTKPGGKWEVNKGLIVGTSSKEEQRHGILISDKKYKDFDLKVVYKAVKGNSGLYFRVDEANDEVGVYGFQAEIDPDKDAGGLYETGGRAWVSQPTPEQVNTWYKKGEWNTMEVNAKGGDITVKVNGKVSAKLVNDPGRREGHIGLQLHGGMEMEVYFKEVLIREK